MGYNGGGRPGWALSFASSKVVSKFVEYGGRGGGQKFVKAVSLGH